MPKKDCDCECKTKTKRKKRTGKKKQKRGVLKNEKSFFTLNSQLYPITQPNIFEYNNALAQANILREQQMKTGSLIPNQQINTLTTSNPITKVNTNTQTEMLDPKEGLVQEIIEYALNTPPVNNEVTTAPIIADRNILGGRLSEDIKPSLFIQEDRFKRPTLRGEREEYDDKFKRPTLRGEPVLMTEPIKKKKKPNIELVIEEEPLVETPLAKTKTKRVRPLKVEPSVEHIPGVKKRIAMKNVSSIPIFAFTPEKGLAKQDITIRDIPFEI